MLSLFLNAHKINLALNDEVGKNSSGMGSSLGWHHVVAVLLQIDLCVDQIGEEFPIKLH